MPETNRMHWDTLLTFKRCSPKSSDDERSEFQRDMDRIWFCDPFRRLARKSQVHPLNENDHIHSRLTHSLEVASVGRSLGEQVGRFIEDRGELPQGLQPYHLGQIVQAACLAHDIGNPPFGHSGEEAIKNWFKASKETLNEIPEDCLSDFTRFDGNAMAVRILLNTGFYGDGMNPTLPVLGALLKYPWPSSFAEKKPKFSYFQTEAAVVVAAIEELGLTAFEGRFARHPLAYLTEAADDICYRLIDLEDATEVGLLPPGYIHDELAGVLELGAESAARCESWHFRQRNSYLRSKLIGKALDEVLETFAAHYDAIMDGSFDHTSSLLDEAQGPVSQRLLEVYAEVSKTLFVSPRKAVLELGAQQSIGALLQVIMREMSGYCSGKTADGEAKVKTILGKDLVEAISPADDACDYHIAMAALDYVTGMSDQYATEMCRKLLGLGF